MVWGALRKVSLRVWGFVEGFERVLGVLFNSIKLRCMVRTILEMITSYSDLQISLGLRFQGLGAPGSGNFGVRASGFTLGQGLVRRVCSELCWPTHARGLRLGFRGLGFRGCGFRAARLHPATGMSWFSSSLVWGLGCESRTPDLAWWKAVGCESTRDASRARLE